MQELISKTKSIIKRFEKIEGKPWKFEGSMIELSKQVGDLSSLIMMYEGYYPTDKSKDFSRYEASKEKIADELADILFVLVRLAVFYDIKLEDSYFKSLEDADVYLQSKNA